MKPLILSGALALFSLLGSSNNLLAQTPQQPGRIAPASEAAISPAFSAGVSSSGNYSGLRISTIEDRHDRIVNRIWISSMISMVAATSMDAATSIGKREGNQLLASSNGSFGAKGVSIKAAAAAGVIIPEVLFRRHKDLKSKFAVGNFAETALFSAVAIHNHGIQRPQ